MGSREINTDFQDLLDKVLAEKISLQEAVSKIEETYGVQVSNLFVVEIEKELRKIS